jgi:hypothetical protein
LTFGESSRPTLGHCAFADLRAGMLAAVRWGLAVTLFSTTARRAAPEYRETENAETHNPAPAGICWIRKFR